MRFGVGTIGDLTWKEMVDSFSCTECGRCQDVCPAYATGKLLSPKLLIMGIRDQVFAEGPNLLAGGELSPIAGNGVPEEMIWDCVTCGACVHECPVSIEHVDHIVDLRRDLVMMQSSFPQEAESMLRDVERVGNPWGKPQGDRASWAEELGVRVLEEGEEPPEVLYWVGCAAAYDERARMAAESTAKLLQKAGVDFAILGAREACTGDPARRMGNEYVFQQYAEQNVATLNEARRDEDRRELPALPQLARQRVPGLRRALRGDAPHAAARRARARRAGCEPTAGEQRDHLPRLLLPRASQRRARRAARARRRGRQAGRDGAQPRSARSAAARAARTCGWRSAARRSTRSACARRRRPGAETLAVACPFCTVMLDDGVRSMGKQLRVVDVSTLLVESMERVDVLVGLGHVDLVCRDVERSLAFYAAVFGALGLRAAARCRGRARRARSTTSASRPAGSGSIGLRQALKEQPFELYAPGFHHLAIAVERTADVELAYEAAVAAGAEILHAPRLWPSYHPDYYATFFLDPDGFRLEVAASRDAAHAGSYLEQVTDCYFDRVRMSRGATVRRARDLKSTEPPGTRRRMSRALEVAGALGRTCSARAIASARAERARARSSRPALKLVSTAAAPRRRSSCHGTARRRDRT